MKSGLKSSLTILVAMIALVSPAVACTAEDTPMPSQTAVAGATVAAVEEVYGLWSVRDGDAACEIALSAMTQGTGHQATVEQCAIPSLASGVLWRPVVGGFELLGPADKVLERFRMTGVDAFESQDQRLRGERAIQF